MRPRFVLTVGSILTFLILAQYPAVVSEVFDLLQKVKFTTVEEFVMLYFDFASRFLFLLVGGLLIIYSTVGGYWASIMICKNRALPKRWRFGFLLLLLLITLVWLRDPPTTIRPTSYPHLARCVLAATDNEAFWVAIHEFIIGVFGLVPLAATGSLWVLDGASALVQFARVGTKWLRGLRQTPSEESLRDFLVAPIAIFPEEPPVSLSALAPVYVDTLLAWAERRRESVQRRLLPTVLFLGFLGLLANTALVSLPVQMMFFYMISVFNLTVIEWALLYSIFLSIMIIIFWLANSLGSALRESFVVDYLVEACTLAQHVREQEQARKERGFLGRLRRWLGLLR